MVSVSFLAAAELLPTFDIAQSPFSGAGPPAIPPAGEEEGEEKEAVAGAGGEGEEAEVQHVTLRPSEQDRDQGSRDADELMGDAREESMSLKYEPASVPQDGEVLGDDVLGGGLFSPRPGEDGEVAPDDDLMAGLDDDTDLMAGLGTREGMDLMGDFREEGGEALGDDVLGGGLFSPRQEDDGEAGVSAEKSMRLTLAAEEVSAELSVEASAEAGVDESQQDQAVSGGVDEAQQDQKDAAGAVKNWSESLAGIWTEVKIFSSSFLLSSLEMSDTTICEP